MLSFIRKHPLGIGTGAAVLLVGLAWLAFGFFGVQTLFVDEVVDEAGPVFDATPATVSTAVADPTETSASDTETAPVGRPAAEASAAEPVADDAATDGTTAPLSPTAAQPTAEQAAAAVTPEIVTEFVGGFVSDAHPTAGTASVLGDGTGQRFLRFENFETDNGPDLNVYLVNSSTGDVSDYIDLGDLKGNIGDQNYEIPAGVDLTVYDEVVIWCVRFGVGFGDALLMPV